MSSRVIFVLTLLLLVAVASGWWWANRAPPPLEWQGYAEADFVKVAPTQQGLLVALHVARGSKVKLGDPLFDQDDTDDRAARDQVERQLRQSEAQLANLQAAGRPTEIDQAQANLADAQAARDKIEADLKRHEQMLKTGGASQQMVDDERADLRSAAAKVQAMEAMLAQMRGPTGRTDEIRAQKALKESNQAALQMAQWRLDQRHVTAPAGGVVADVMARPGETIPAGVPVVSLLPPENIFVRFFVPEEQLSGVHLGDRVAFRCDSCPADLGGTVSFIAPQAEYTPPVIYSEASRAKLVYSVEARPPSAQAPLINPGQPVAVRPIGSPPP